MPISTISHTAWLVMISQIGLKQDPAWQAHIPDEHRRFYGSCYEYCRGQSWIYRAIHHLIPLPFHLKLIERMLAYGAPQHFVLRKQAIARQAAEFLREGGQQLVVIGGGFDALAVHAARKYPQVACIELDTPLMSEHKLNCIRACYGTLPENFHGIGNDFSCYSLFDALSKHPAFSAEKVTLFIAEGVMVYLQERDVIKLFGDMRALCRKPYSLLFSAVEKHREKGEGWWGRAGKLILKVKNENFAWSISCGDLPGFLARQGLDQNYQMSYAQLQQPHRSPAEMAILERQNGEYLAYATRKQS